MKIYDYKYYGCNTRKDIPEFLKCWGSEGYKILQFNLTFGEVHISSSIGSSVGRICETAEPVRSYDIIMVKEIEVPEDDATDNE